MDKLPEISRNYSILTGQLDYFEKKLQNKYVLSTLAEIFATPLFEDPSDNRASLHDFIKTYYYDNFRSISFPESKKFDKKNKPGAVDIKGYLKHFGKPLKLRMRPACIPPAFSLTEGTSRYMVEVKWIELSFYPSGLAFYSFKIELLTGALSLLSLDDISSYVSKLRNVSTHILLGTDISSKSILLSEWISREILRTDSLSVLWKTDRSRFNKLKVYTAVEYVSSQSGRTENDDVLYRLSNLLPISTQSPQNEPSLEFKEDQLKKNSFAMFGNWKLLSILDTTTFLFNSPVGNSIGNPFDNTEQLFFPLYRHSLFLKHFLYKTNARIDRYSIAHPAQVQIKTIFNNVWNKYHFRHVSLNYLPNAVYANFLTGMEIDEEAAYLKNRLESIAKSAVETQSKQTNLILKFLFFASILSGILGFSNSMKNVLQVTKEVGIVLDRVFLGVVVAVGIAYGILQAIKNRKHYL